MRRLSRTFSDEIRLHRNEKERCRTRRVIFQAIFARLFSFVQKCFIELNPASVFHRNWHHEALAYQFERVLSGETSGS